MAQKSLPQESYVYDGHITLSHIMSFYSSIVTFNFQ
jgi:hypothetical protein